MTTPYEWFPFHEDEAVAAAVGAALTADSSIEEVATRYGVDSDSVVAAVVELGCTEYVAADFPTGTPSPSREPPEFSAAGLR